MGSRPTVKNIAKSLARLLALLAVMPLIVIDQVARHFDNDALFSALSQFLSLIPGRVGSYLRVAFYRLTIRRCHPDCHIGFGTLLSQRDTEIGRGVYIGPQCNIGACRIRDDALIASGVHLMSGTRQHRFSDLERPIRDQGGEFRPIDIGEDSWIGNGALVMANIGARSVIGAGAVVTRDVPEYAIAAGNPARVLRLRHEPPAEAKTKQTTP